MRHTFNGRLYRVRSQSGLDNRTLAQCDHGRRVIQIPVDGDTQNELDWIIHESLHASMPYLAEGEVGKTATCVARLLWRLGWRNE